MKNTINENIKPIINIENNEKTIVEPLTNLLNNNEIQNNCFLESPLKNVITNKEIEENIKCYKNITFNKEGFYKKSLLLNKNLKIGIEDLLKENDNYIYFEEPIFWLYFFDKNELNNIRDTLYKYYISDLIKISNILKKQIFSFEYNENVLLIKKIKETNYFDLGEIKLVDNINETSDVIYVSFNKDLNILNEQLINICSIYQIIKNIFISFEFEYFNPCNIFESIKYYLKLCIIYILIGLINYKFLKNNFNAKLIFNNGSALQLNFLSDKFVKCHNNILEIKLICDTNHFNSLLFHINQFIKWFIQGDCNFSYDSQKSIFNYCSEIYKNVPLLIIENSNYNIYSKTENIFKNFEKTHHYCLLHYFYHIDYIYSDNINKIIYYFQNFHPKYVKLLNKSIFFIQIIKKFNDFNDLFKQINFKIKNIEMTHEIINFIINYHSNLKN
jgi:hypothetical protein